MGFAVRCRSGMGSVGRRQSTGFRSLRPTPPAIPLYLPPPLSRSLAALPSQNPQLKHFPLNSQTAALPRRTDPPQACAPAGGSAGHSLGCTVGSLPPRQSAAEWSPGVGKNAQHTTPAQPPVRDAPGLRTLPGCWVRKNAGQDRGRGTLRPYHCPAAVGRVSRRQLQAKLCPTAPSCPPAQVHPPGAARAG
jgi:hypothetical protein